MRHAIAAAIVLGFAAASTAQADIYRWVDGQGSVHYSDRWVPGATLVQVTHKGANDAAIAAKMTEQAKVATAGDRASAELSKEQQAAIVRQETQQAQADTCKKLQDRYQKAIASPRIIVEDSPGKTRRLDDKEAEAARIQARQERDEACAKAGIPVR